MPGRANSVARGNSECYSGGSTSCTPASARNPSGLKTKKKYCLGYSKSLETTGLRSPNTCPEEVITTLKIIFIVV